MNNEKRKSAEINNRIIIGDDKVVVARSSTAGGGSGGDDKGKIELLQIQVANIEQSSDHSNTTINDADADSSDTQSMRIILPVFIENEQKYAQMDQHRRKIHSSPAKTTRRFSQDSTALEQQQQKSSHPPPRKKVSPILKCNRKMVLFLPFTQLFCGPICSVVCVCACVCYVFVFVFVSQAMQLNKTFLKKNNKKKVFKKINIETTQTNKQKCMFGITFVKCHNLFDSVPYMCVGRPLVKNKIHFSNNHITLH